MELRVIWKSGLEAERIGFGGKFNFKFDVNVLLVEIF